MGVELSYFVMLATLWLIFAIVAYVAYVTWWEIRESNRVIREHRKQMQTIPGMKANAKN